MRDRKRGRRRFGWAVFLVSVLVGGLLAAVLLTRSSEDGPPVCARFGVAAPADWEEMSEDEFRAMIDEQVYLGARDIRLAAVWQDIEPRPGDYEWEALDGRLQIALDAGLTPLLLIHTHPDWVTGFGEIGSGAAEAYGDFAGEVARRYSDRVHAYEIWNEPNLERFWPDPDPDAFAELLAAAGPRIAAADPEAEIVSGGLSPATNRENTSVAPVDFLRRLYELGAQEYFTVVGMHPYSYPERPSGGSDWNSFGQMAQMTALMDEAGDTDTQIWVTEIGAPSDGDRGVGESAQADLIAEALELIDEDPRLGRAYLYTMYDIDLGQDNPESHFGLLHAPGEPKEIARRLAAGTGDEAAPTCDFPGM